MKKKAIQNAIFLHPSSCTRIPYLHIYKNENENQKSANFLANAQKEKCAGNMMRVQIAGCEKYIP